MNKLLLFIILSISITSCTRIDKISLTVKKVDDSKCKYHLSDKINHLTLKGGYDFKFGDKYKLESTDQDTGLIFYLKSYSSYESNLCDYYIKSGKSVIVFRDSIDKWSFDSKFKLVKND